MYCPSCGKIISDKSKFCSECGAQISSTLPVQSATEWDYEDFVLSFPTGNSDTVPACRIGGGNPNLTPAQARVNFWEEYQSDILLELRKKLDQGWEALTEVGPSAIQYEEYQKTVSDVDGGTVVGGIFSLGLLPILQAVTGNLAHKETWCKPIRVSIKIRRPKR